MGIVGVKYCGGCNPRIDRAGLVRELERLLAPDDCLEIIRKPTGCGAAVLVCGCERACADSPVVRELARNWIVVSGPAVDLEPVPEDSLAAAVARKIKSSKRGVEN